MLTGCLLGSFMATLAAQTTADPLEKGWVRPPKSDLRVIFTTQHKRDLGEFELLKSNEEEWTRPFISADSARLFVGTRTGQVLAISPDTGDLLWERRDMGTVGAAMVEYKDLLLVGSDSAFLGLDRATGETKWSIGINGRIGSEITLTGDIAILPVRPNTFIAVDLSTQKIAWRVQRQTPDGITVRGQAPATVDRNRNAAYLGFSDGALVAVNLDDGGNQWIVQLGERREFFADVDAAPVLLDGGRSILAASYNGGLARLKAEDGSIEYKQSDVLHLTGLVDVGNGLVVGTYGDGQLLGIYAANGKVRWRYRLRIGAPTAPVYLGDGYVMAGCTEGPITILNRSTGEPVQVIDLSSGVSLPPFYRSGYLAAMTNTGLLLIFRGSTSGIAAN